MANYESLVCDECQKRTPFIHPNFMPEIKRKNKHRHTLRLVDEIEFPFSDRWGNADDDYEVISTFHHSIRDRIKIVISKIF
jgi:hypothetical protein